MKWSRRCVHRASCSGHWWRGADALACTLPGGCAIGARPINLHVTALEHLGAEVRQDHGYIEAVAPSWLRGGTVQFDRITVTGTEDVLMAAVLAKGRDDY